MPLAAGVASGHWLGMTLSVPWHCAQYAGEWQYAQVAAPTSRVTCAWSMTMLSCGTWTAFVLWQFSQYVRVWHAPHAVFAGSTVETAVLWSKIQRRLSCVAGRCPMRTPEVWAPIWGNVWHVAQPNGIASLVIAPSTTL